VSCIGDGIDGTRSEGGGNRKKDSDPLILGVNLVHVLGAIEPLLLSLKRGSCVSCLDAIQICGPWWCYPGVEIADVLRVA
jgi:hypothetical protein